MGSGWRLLAYLGGLLALNLRISQHVLGFFMAFGAGVLISAVAYELVQEAMGISGGAALPWGSSAGLSSSLRVTC
jgi:zinc transporter, ZIP family